MAPRFHCKRGDVSPVRGEREYNFRLREAGGCSMRSLLALVLAVCPLIRAAQETESPNIRPGEIPHISVLREPDLSCSVVVRSDGFISMPLLNEIEVAGLTVQQVQKLLVVRLQRFVANPEVTVSVGGKVHTHPTLPSLWPFVQAAHPLIAAEPAG